MNSMPSGPMAQVFFCSAKPFFGVRNPESKVQHSSKCSTNDNSITLACCLLASAAIRTNAVARRVYVLRTEPSIILVQAKQRTSMDELTPLLQRFSVEVVEASRQVSRDAIAYCMNTVIQPIVSAMGRADARFKCYVPLPTDQYFEAMKVSASDEFELIVILDNLVSMKSFRDLSETNPNLSCYGEVLFTQSFSTDMWAADLCVPVRHGPHSFLSAAKIRQYFAKLVGMIAADIFHNGMVQVSFKGKVHVCLLQFVYILAKLSSAWT